MTAWVKLEGAVVNLAHVQFVQLETPEQGASRRAYDPARALVVVLTSGLRLRSSWEYLGCIENAIGYGMFELERARIGEWLTTVDAGDEVPP